MHAPTVDNFPQYYKIGLDLPNYNVEPLDFPERLQYWRRTDMMKCLRPRLLYSEYTPWICKMFESDEGTIIKKGRKM
jgi:hypothetical protein